MAQDNPNGSDGDGGKKPTAEQLQIAAAISSLEAKYEAAQKNRTEHDRKALLWTKRTAKGVFVYTALTVGITVASLWSSWIAQRAVNLTAKNFIASERPFLWLTNDFGFPEFKQFPGKPTGQVTWEWHFTNYGKTPANAVHHHVFMRLGDGKFRPSYGPAKSDATVPMPPNGYLRHAAVSPPDELTAANYADLIAKDFGISISGVIEYIDLSGEHYESTFCITKLATGAIRIADPTENCKNEIK